MFVDYDPEEHKTEQLFEVQSTENSQGEFITTYIKSDIERTAATNIPWFFVVEVEDGDANA